MVGASKASSLRNFRLTHYPQSCAATFESQFFVVPAGSFIGKIPVEPDSQVADGARKAIIVMIAPAALTIKA
jgi:hypothetical protein